MKRLLILFISSLAIFGCSQKSDISPADVKQEINSLLDGWHQNAAKPNFEKYFDAMDSLSVYIGTDALEIWSKQQFMAFSKPYFDRGDAWNFKPLRRDVYLNQQMNFAWFNESLNTWMGICTASGVLERTNNGWKIKHYQLSVAISNELIMDVVRLKSSSDSLLVDRIKKYKEF